MRSGTVSLPDEEEVVALLFASILSSGDWVVLLVCLGCEGSGEGGGEHLESGEERGVLTCAFVTRKWRRE